MRRSLIASRCFLFTTLMACTLHGVAETDPTVNINWSECPGNPRKINRTAAEGPVATAIVTARGFTGAVRATQAWLFIRHYPYQDLPDAWRFDDAGCQAGKFKTPLEAGGAGCAFLAPSPTQTITNFSVGEVGGRAVFAMVFDPLTPNPAATYTIARFEFDQSNPACACLDQAQCLSISLVSYLDQDLIEHNFIVEQEFLLWEDANNSTYCPGGPDLCNPCDPPVPNPCNGQTPARARTWGAIKGQYR
jgi:hypothetical protein